VIAVVTGVIAGGAGLYIAARETSVFAVRQLVVKGGSPTTRAEVRRALAPVMGRSLLRVSEGDLRERTLRLSDLVSLEADRSFPNTLEVTIRSERPVLLLRRGSHSWLVSARGRVIRELARPQQSRLPRYWAPAGVRPVVGGMLKRDEGGLAAAAVSPFGPAGAGGGIRSVIATEDTLSLELRTGPEIRLGGIGDLPLKLAIARRIIRMVGSEATPTSYIDVSVPGRPVMGTSVSTTVSAPALETQNPQVTSTG